MHQRQQTAQQAAAAQQATAAHADYAARCERLQAQLDAGEARCATIERAFMRQRPSAAAPPSAGGGFVGGGLGGAGGSAAKGGAAASGAPPSSSLLTPHERSPGFAPVMGYGPGGMAPTSAGVRHSQGAWGGAQGPPRARGA